MSFLDQKKSPRHKGSFDPHPPTLAGGSNARGALASITAPLDRVTAFDSDAAGRVTKRTQTR